MGWLDEWSACLCAPRHRGDLVPYNDSDNRIVGHMGRLILGLETLPWNILYRVVIGYYVMPVTILVCGVSPTAAQLFLLFIAVLVSLRIVPSVLRRLIPAGAEVKEVWAERRATAKRYDSYQWQKLFGIGMGWVAYLFLHRRASGAPVALAGACLVAGAIGQMFWFRASRFLHSQAVPNAPV